MRTFIAVTGDPGVVMAASQRSRGGPTEARPIEVEDPAQLVLLRGDLKRVRWVNGHVEAKPVVRILADKPEPLANGEDVVTVSFTELPEVEYPLAVRVRDGTQTHEEEVPFGEVLEITTERTDPIEISAASPLVWGEPVTLLPEDDV